MAAAREADRPAGLRGSGPALGARARRHGRQASRAYRGPARAGGGPAAGGRRARPRARPTCAPPGWPGPRNGPGGTGARRARPARDRHPHLVARRTRWWRCSPRRSTRYGPGPGGEPLRLRVMASLARVLAWHGLDLPRARALAAQAVAAGPGGRRPGALAAACWPSTTRSGRPGTARDRLADRRRGGRAGRASRRPRAPARGPPAGRDRPARAGRPGVPRRAGRVPQPGRRHPPAAVPLRRAGPPGHAGPAGRPASPRPSG